MIDDKGRSRCNDCSRFLADRYPYHVCQRCQERGIASRRLLARVDKVIASWDEAEWADAGGPQ